METIQIQKPKQLEYVDETQRIFKVWGTVDIVDKQGERLQVRPYFDKVMPIIMKRGGVITFGHTDHQCAKILNYEIKRNENTGTDGVLLTVQMFDDYDTDDKVWDGIKKGYLPAVSFKGAGVVDSFSSVDAEKLVKVLEGYGFAIVDHPANPEALVTEVNYLAKSGKCKECGHEYGDEKEKSKELKLISQSEQNNNQNTNGGNTMAETKVETKEEAKPEFVTKEEYGVLSTKVDTIARGQDAILEAIKALQPAAKKEDDEDKPDEEEKKKAEKSIDEKIDEKFKEIMKGFGTNSTTPRPAAPAPQGTGVTNTIEDWLGQFDHLNVAKIAEVSKSLEEREVAAQMKF